MILRPATATWFELLTAREELGAALECLATTGAVQLQAHSSADARLALPDLRVTLLEFETLSRRYGHFWPTAVMQPPSADRDLMEAPRTALEQVRAWTVAAEPLIAELEALEAQSADLALLDELLYSLPADGQVQAVPPAVLLQRVPHATGEFCVAVGPREDIAQLDLALTARKARTVAMPADLPENPADVGAFLSARRNDLEARRHSASAALDALSRQHRLAEALGELALAAWLVTHVPELPVTEHFAWVTGWCSDPDDRRLRSALDSRALHYPCCT